jgi:hypothetical protein
MAGGELLHASYLLTELKVCSISLLLVRAYYLTLTDQVLSFRTLKLGSVNEVRAEEIVG